MKPSVSITALLFAFHTSCGECSSSRSECDQDEPASQGGALDYTNNVSCLYNGKTGAAFAFNFELDSEIFLPPGFSDHLSNNSDQSFEDFFSNLPSPKQLFELGEKVGFLFNSSSVTGEISEEIAQILGSLSTEFSSRCYALYNYNHVCKITSDTMKSSLEGFGKVMGDVDSGFRGDFKWIVELFQGLGSLFGSIEGGMGALSDAGVTLRFDTIMNAQNGFYVLIYFMENWPESVNVEEGFRATLNSEEDFFMLINKMGGELTYGFDGFVNVIYHILCYVDGKSSEEDVFSILNAYFSSKTLDNGDLREEWTGSIVDLLETIKKLRLTNYYRNLTNVLDNIIRNTWIRKGVNISLIIKVLLQVDPGDTADAIAAVLELLESDQHKHLIPHLSF